MKKFATYLLCGLMSVQAAKAQETVYPAKPQEQPILISNGMIHVGNGQVINNGSVLIENGKISAVGASVNAPSNAMKVDAAGKHVYPSLILSVSDLGLREVGSGTRATNDVQELGEINPNVRSIVAYNTDSKIINTLRNSGILIVHTVPRGGLIMGSSSVVQLDAWNWEDAAYAMDNGIHLDMPSLLNRPRGGFGQQARPGTDPLKAAMERIESAKQFFREAKSYSAEQEHSAMSLKYEAVKGLFDKSKKLFVHANLVKEMLVAVDFVKEFGFDVVIVGGSESFLIADLLKQHNLPVILNQMHAIPTTPEDDVDQPYKTPAALQKAGVLFAINDNDGQFRGRNLGYNAGTAATYGLTKEQALSAITLNAAKILGIDKKTGSIEAGKDANIVISEGDILDMRSSRITNAFIQGRVINLDDKQKQLYERYKHKYGL
jgi:imidazolonepropionase-like amidohydrolase